MFSAGMNDQTNDVVHTLSGSPHVLAFPLAAAEAVGG